MISPHLPRRKTRQLNRAPTLESTLNDTLEAAEARYLEVLDAFVSQASHNQHMVALVEALTWTLARIAVGCVTSTVAGDILGRLGRHMVDQSVSYGGGTTAARPLRERVTGCFA